MTGVRPNATLLRLRGHQTLTFAEEPAAFYFGGA